MKCKYFECALSEKCIFVTQDDVFCKNHCHLSLFDKCLYKKECGKCKHSVSSAPIRPRSGAWGRGSS